MKTDNFDTNRRAPRVRCVMGVLRGMMACCLAIFGWQVLAEDITPGEMYVILQDDTVAFTTQALAERYRRALDDGESPRAVAVSWAGSVGGSSSKKKEEHKADVIKAAGKKVGLLDKGRKVKAVGVENGIVCVQVNKKRKAYVQPDDLIPLTDYVIATTSTKPVGPGQGILKGPAFLFKFSWHAREYIELVAADIDAAVKWGASKMVSSDAITAPMGTKFIVVEAYGEIAKITFQSGSVFWCRCVDIAME